jgi:hypothetical protein
MKAFADGRPIECRADAWGRVIVPLKGAARVLEVLYRPPWMLSVLAGLGIAVSGGILGLFLRFRENRRPVPQGMGA